MMRTLSVNVAVESAIFFILILYGLLHSVESVAYPPVAKLVEPCPTTLSKLGAAIVTTNSRSGFLDAYLWGNTHFPQTDIGIISSMLQHYLTNPTRAVDFLRKPTAIEIEVVGKEMNRLHKDCGVSYRTVDHPEYDGTHKVKPERLRRLLIIEGSNAVGKIYEIVSIFGAELPYVDTSSEKAQVLDTFLGATTNRNILQRSYQFGEIVRDTLHDHEVLAVASRYRKFLEKHPDFKTNKDKGDLWAAELNRIDTTIERVALKKVARKFSEIEVRTALEEAIRALF